MAICVPHVSRVEVGRPLGGGAVGGGVGRVGGVAPAGAGLSGMAAGLAQLGVAMNEAAADAARQRNAADLLAEKMAYEDETRAFEEEWRQAHQGQAARGTREAVAAFHAARQAKMREKWADHPALLAGADELAANARTSALRRMGAWEEGQEKAWQASVRAASQARAVQKFADPHLSWEEKVAILNEEEDAMRVLAGQRRTQDAQGHETWSGGHDVGAEVIRLRQKLIRAHARALRNAGAKEGGEEE